MREACRLWYGAGVVWGVRAARVWYQRVYAGVSVYGIQDVDALFFSRTLQIIGILHKHSAFCVPTVNITWTFMSHSAYITCISYNAPLSLLYTYSDFIARYVPYVPAGDTCQLMTVYTLYIYI